MSEALLYVVMFLIGGFVGWIIRGKTK